MKMNKVLIATPCLYGKLDVWYTNSLVHTERLAQANNIILDPEWIAYDALIQNARNCLFQVAVKGEYDDVIWIDDDIEWNPQWIFDLLSYSVDVVGGTYRKKTDYSEQYVVKTKNLLPSDSGLIKVESLGMGFVRMSRKAILDLWINAKQYVKDGAVHRMVCNLDIIDGELYSEDTIVFHKLAEKGYDIWLDPKMTCNHIGTKKFCGSFENFISRL